MVCRRSCYAAQMVVADCRPTDVPQGWGIRAFAARILGRPESGAVIPRGSELNGGNRKFHIGHIPVFVKKKALFLMAAARGNFPTPYRTARESMARLPTIDQIGRREAFPLQYFLQYAMGPRR